MLHKVEALSTYEELKIKDANLNKIVPEGFQFEVDDERLEVLLGKNDYRRPFVKVVEKKKAQEPKEEEVEEPKEEIVEEVKPKKKKNK